MRFAAAVLLLSAATLAFAQMRTLPENAERGTLRHVQENVFTVDGKMLRLAPGGTIRGPNNLILMPAALPREGALAEYVLDKDGMIFQAWLLTPQEASREKKKKKR